MKTVEIARSAAVCGGAAAVAGPPEEAKMTLKEFILTIEDKNGFKRDVKVIATDSSSAVRSIAYGNRYQYNDGVVVDVKESV